MIVLTYHLCLLLNEDWNNIHIKHGIHLPLQSFDHFGILAHSSCKWMAQMVSFINFFFNTDHWNFYLWNVVIQNSCLRKIKWIQKIEWKKFEWIAVKLPDYNSYQDSDFDNLIIWFWCNDDVSVIWGTSNAMSI